jgi:hypothetical protein
MSTQIEINYSNPQKPTGVVGGTPSIPLNGQFSFFSLDGPVQIQFIGDSPFLPHSHTLHPGHTALTATKPGRYKFRCFLTVHGQAVELDPNSPGATGGELEVQT